MSNLTEGKKALADGEFVKAENKLLKALDNRPDDSELWWSLMLCKFRFKSDDELKAELCARYESAAKSGEAAPESPFDSQYCKNALRYAINTKRRGFIDGVNAELSAIWERERGKPLHIKKTPDYKPPKHIDYKKIVKPIAYAFAAAGAVLMVFALFLAVSTALTAGAIVFYVFATIGSCMNYLQKREARGARAALVSRVIIFIGLDVLVLGIFYGVTLAIWLSAVVVGLTVLYMSLSRTLDRINKRVIEKQGNGKKSARPDYDRKNVAQAPVQKNKKEPKVSDYEDKFD